MIFDVAALWLILWLVQNAAVDVSCAIKGTENPRYALKRQKALAAGKQAPAQPRYGSRDWFGDLVSDGLAAQTERRRAKAAEKAKTAKRDERPLDDLAEAVREEHRRPVAPATVDTEEFPEFRRGPGPTPSVVHEDGRADDPIQRVMDRIVEQRARNGGSGLTKCQHCGTTVNVGYLHPRTINGQRKQVCAHCAGLIKVDASLLTPVPNGQPANANDLLFAVTEDGKTARSVPPRGPSVPADVLATARAALAEMDPEGHRRLAVLDRVATRVEKVHPNVDPAMVDEAVVLADRNETYMPDPYAAVRGNTPESDNRPATYRFNSDDMRGFEPLTVTCTRDELADRIRDHLDPGGNFDFDVEVSEDGRTAAIRNHGEDPHGTVRIARIDEPKDTRPDAVIYQFPNPKKIEKEIRMATSEVTGLSTALAFAQTAADAHASFATGGTEGYTGALAQHGVGDGCISSAKEAQEASSIAAAKWAKHHEDLTAQLNVKEAYQGNPDAGNKQFLLNG
ncbi:hypothetical protein ACFP2T_16580 [Plantactinospora solaniradicis]|uniref:Uncharacterized protein n=1 Tax=Plantactinospora solaniradicis TaxID=1723736 RepID=A0ABW1K881_9ACTN